jgi:hypothetical protein
MTTMMLRSTMHEENAADVQAALEKVFQALEQEQPAGVRYTSIRLGDGVTFVALLELENVEDNPMAALPAYAELLENLKQWQEGPPALEQITVIGSYRLF